MTEGIRNPPDLAFRCFSRHFHLVDLTVMGDEDFERQRSAYMMCAMLKHAYSRDYAREVERLFELGQFRMLLETVDLKTAGHVLKYIHHSIERLDEVNPGEFLAKLLEVTPDDKKELTMTLADYLREEGMKASHQEAMEFAASKAARDAGLETVRKMLSKGFLSKDIADVTGLSLEEIEALRSEF